MIEYKNVALRYTEKTVLKDVNLRIEDGEFMVLVGPSGSGKTTMMKMINQLIEPTDGNIYLNDKRIKDHDQRELRLETGYVLQQIALFPNLTVAENIALIPEMKGWKKEQIQEQTKVLLEKVGLSFEDYAHRYPKELSGGEQQRVAIARAIVNRPTVLIADEPTGNLDPDTSKDIVELFKHINNFGTTVIMVTHNMDLVSYLNKRVIRLKDGRVQSDNMRGAEINEA